VRKNVLFVTTVSRTIQAFLIPHIRYFLDQGYEVGVAANTDGEPLDELINIGVTVHHVPFSRTVMNWENWKAFKQIRKISKMYAVLHLHTPIASFLTRMAASKQQEIIYTVHGFHFHEHGRPLSNLVYALGEKAAGLRTKRIIVTNKDDLAAAKKLLPNKMIHYVHGVGIDTKLFKAYSQSDEEQRKMKAALGVALQTKIITHIAEFNENKRQTDVIDACALLKNKRDDFIMLLVGSGKNEEIIRQYIQKRQLEDHVKCLGFRTDIPAILGITDIGLLVSIREGLPRSVMEMMALKIPVVATNIRGNRDLIENGKTGFLVPVKSPAAIADKCLFLLNNRHLAERFGENGRAKIETNFSLPVVLNEMEQIYKGLNRK
jgi:glycosyltransferase involved in cell wall biosynthesis